MRRGGLDEPAVVEDRDVVADPLDVVEDVGRVEDRRLALQLAHQVEDVLAADRVERRHRLVEQDHRRPADEGLGDAEPLAHAARVGRRPPVGRFGDADAPEQLADLALAIGADAAKARDVAERLATGHPAVEAGVLGEVPKVAAMVAGRGHRDAVDGGASGRRAGEPGKDLQGSRLAGAVRAEEAEDGAGRDVQRQVGQRLDVLVVLGEAIHRDGVGHEIAPYGDRDDARGRTGVVSWTGMEWMS